LFAVSPSATTSSVQSTARPHVGGGDGAPQTTNTVAAIAFAASPHRAPCHHLHPSFGRRRLPAGAAALALNARTPNVASRRPTRGPPAVSRTRLGPVWGRAAAMAAETQLASTCRRHCHDRVTRLRQVDAALLAPDPRPTGWWVCPSAVIRGTPFPLRHRCR